MDTKINYIFFVQNACLSEIEAYQLKMLKIVEFEPKTVLFVLLITRQNLQGLVVEPSVVQILTSLKKVFLSMYGLLADIRRSGANFKSKKKMIPVFSISSCVTTS